MKILVVTCTVLCIVACKAFEYDQSAVLTEDGDTVYVENIHDNNKSISIIKKGGETEIQTSGDNERYTIVKKNGSCVVTFNKDASTGCYEAVDWDDSYTNEEHAEINEECQGYQIVFVKPVSCGNEHSLQKRSCIRIRICVRLCVYRWINGRRRCIIIIPVCFYRCRR